MTSWAGLTVVTFPSTTATSIQRYLTSFVQLSCLNNFWFVPPLSHLFYRRAMFNYSLYLFFYWSACINPGNWVVMYLCVRGIDFSIFYDLTIGFWNCSDSVYFSIFFSFYNDKTKHFSISFRIIIFYFLFLFYMY